jgi:phosphoglycerate kinase
MSVCRLEELDGRGKRVLVREDLNVPMTDGRITDYGRIDAALPTLRWLHDQGARTVVLSHLGRPNGRPQTDLSLRPVAQALADRLGIRVAFAGDSVGEATERAVAELHDGDVVLLENVRFHPEEERNDLAFARRLAKLGDYYVNDAFATAHRAHASTEALAHLLPSATGFLMASELAALSQLVDAFCIGGGMANTLLAASGLNVGRSLRDDDLEPARQILSLSKERRVDLQLPSDAVVAPAVDAQSQARVVAIGAVGDEMILDIGPGTAQAYAATIERAKTIVFNGPMGVYELPAYRHGTQVVGDAIARATAAGATSVVGGGDAAAAAHLLGFASKVTHLSTGGGATLEYLEGKVLPGVAALEQ